MRNEANLKCLDFLNLGEKMVEQVTMGQIGGPGQRDNITEEAQLQ